MNTIDKMVLILEQYTPYGVDFEGCPLWAIAEVYGGFFGEDDELYQQYLKDIGQI